VKVEAKKEVAATRDETNAKPESGDIIAQKEINSNTASLIKEKVGFFRLDSQL
jgi:hypothetical protein